MFRERVELVHRAERNEPETGSGDNWAEVWIRDNRHLVSPCLQRDADAHEGMHIARAVHREQKDSHGESGRPHRVGLNRPGPAAVTNSLVLKAGTRLASTIAATGPTMAIQTMLVVCAGNLCRSPMGEALFRRRIRNRPALARIVVSSAGTIAREGQPPPYEAVEVMRHLFGLDMARHRAHVFGRDTQADLILTVDRWTTEQAEAIQVSGSVCMLGDFVGSAEEVVDPYGGSIHGCQRTARQLDRLVDAAIDRLETDTASPTFTRADVCR